MKIVLFSHPAFLGQQSMPRFTNMLADNMRLRGHEVDIYSPKAYFHRLPLGGALKKWLGYIDQYLIFPILVKQRIKKNKADIYIFTDQALGIWVPIVKGFRHLIICHDFLAQRSAEGDIPQNPTGWSGRIYQKLIRNGYSSGENFVSVSQRSQHDLHHFLGKIPQLSKVIYNGLNKEFITLDQKVARDTLNTQTRFNFEKGYILHVGGNQWYKNRLGVVKIYNAFCTKYGVSIPLVLIGTLPSRQLQNEINLSPFKDNIQVFDSITDQYINVAYSGATVLLFPSIAEGFGWPIAEAMESGCPVITTNDSPMTEVGGAAAEYIPVMPLDENNVGEWALCAAEKLNKFILLRSAERQEIVNNGILNAKRFDTGFAMDEMEKTILEICHETR
jgi:glycosyltransferase involved in cell wall biosynthesis